MATDKMPAKSERKRKVVDSNYAEPWKPNKGQVLEGIYLGFDSIPGNRGNFRSYRIKVDGEEKPSGIAGSFLDSVLPRIPKGSYVWITYLGMKNTKNGEAHDYKVETEDGVKLLEIAPESDENF